MVALFTLDLGGMGQTGEAVVEQERGLVLILLSFFYSSLAIFPTARD